MGINLSMSSAQAQHYKETVKDKPQGALVCESSLMSQECNIEGNEGEIHIITRPSLDTSDRFNYYQKLNALNNSELNRQIVVRKPEVTTNRVRSSINCKHFKTDTLISSSIFSQEVYGFQEIRPLINQQKENESQRKSSHKNVGESQFQLAKSSKESQKEIKNGSRSRNRVSLSQDSYFPCKQGILKSGRGASSRPKTVRFKLDKPDQKSKRSTLSNYRLQEVEKISKKSKKRL